MWNDRDLNDREYENKMKKHLHNHQKTMGEYIFGNENWKKEKILFLFLYIFLFFSVDKAFISSFSISWTLKTRRWFHSSHTCCDDLEISFLLCLKSISKAMKTKWKEEKMKWEINCVCCFYFPFFLSVLRFNGNQISSLFIAPLCSRLNFGHFKSPFPSFAFISIVSQWTAVIQ